MLKDSYKNSRSYRRIEFEKWYAIVDIPFLLHYDTTNRIGTKINIHQIYKQGDYDG